ncbi:hypothetical protein, partial [uncultured Veillonella sp.]|uniref:hypothetical protein n=1 Tax=uncultured Veillonella sp. TaxID=159268 RepID=UPI0026582A35
TNQSPQIPNIKSPPILSLIIAKLYDILSNPGQTIYIEKPMIIEMNKQDRADNFKYRGYLL